MTYPVSLAENAGWDDRIAVVHGGDLVDAFIVTTRRYVILVDTLISPETGTELLAFARPRLTTGRTLLAVNTHADWDHCWGNQLFAGSTPVYPAPILGTRRSAERLRSSAEGDTLARMRGKQPGVFDRVELTAPTIAFDGEATIDGGDLTLRLFPTPGHQPDHLSVYIPEIRTLLAGDAAEFPFPFAESPEALPALRESLRRMVALGPAAALYCHAPITAGPKLLVANLAYFDRLESACRAAIARGVATNPLPDADVVALVGLRLEDAVPPVDARPYPPFYLNGHADQLRIMLAWLGNEGRNCPGD
ncbi:MAG TPA: MBL fold metallo-hydrolase [Aggregatilineales bacterium]|nr:MBL fold metallo-hydrolase [Aggregatilineales bacterium]